MRDIGTYSHQASPMVYCGDNRVSFVHSKIDTVAATPDTLARVDINFHQTYREAAPLGMGKNSHHYNYYYAHCPEGVTLTPSYERVVFPELYEKTDLHIKGNNNWMKFEFVVHPGGNPEDILMTFEGAENVEVIQQLGLLIVTSSIGTYVFPKPTALKIDTVGTAVELGWQPDWDLSVTGDTVRFTNIGSYNPAEVLVFTLGEEPMAVAAADFENLVWCTHIGGRGLDAVEGLDIDANGDMYMSGNTSSNDFPVLDGIDVMNQAGDGSAFVGKVAPYGTRKWVTYYGENNTAGTGIVTDDNGNVYSTGRYANFESNQSFPVEFVSGAYYLEPTNVDVLHVYAYLLKLNQSNGVRSWATVFGDNSVGTRCDGNALALDKFGNIVLVGLGMKKDDFPIYKDASLPNAYQQSTTDEQLGFVASFHSTSNKLLWSTLFGSANTNVTDVCIAGLRGDIVITGTVSDDDYGNFPLEAQTNQVSQTFGGGESDAFVAQFDYFNGSHDLLWSTFLGGASSESGLGIDYNSENLGIYVVGETASTDFPTIDNMNVSSINRPTLTGVSDGFITKYIFENDMTWCTYFGGDNTDYGGNNTDLCKDISVNPSGYVFITGETRGDGFELEQMTDGYYQENLENISGGGIHSDSYITSIDVNDDLVWSTYLGGESYINGSNNGGAVNSRDEGWAITADEYNVFVGGRTTSRSDFPWVVDNVNHVDAYYQNFNASVINPNIATSAIDGFLAQFRLTGTPLNVEEEEMSIDESGIRVYPNPSSGQLNVLVSNREGDIFKFSIYTSMGKEVMSMDVKASSSLQYFKLDISGVASGLYHLVSYSKGKVSSNKIVIR